MLRLPWRPHMLRSLLIACVLALLALLAPAAIAQQEFSSESGSWTFTMPAGWQVMGKDSTTKLNEQFADEAEDKASKVVCAFSKGSGLFPYPQVVLQVLEFDVSKMSWGSLRP